MRRAVDQIRRDVAYGARQLASAPAFTFAAVVSLALGIAVNSAAFSVISALLLRPLSPTDGGDLVRIGRSVRGEQSFRSSSYRDFRHLSAHASTLEAVFGEHLQSLTVSGPEGTEIAAGEIVTGNYFTGLRVGAALGRTLTRDDDTGPGASAVVVISDRLWRRRFAADQNVVGRLLTINTRPFTIVGVAPPFFPGTFPGVPIDVWIPSQTARTISHRDAEEPSLMLMGRLAPGHSIGAAAAELDALAAQLARTDPQSDQRSFAVAPARGAHPLIARLIGTFLWLLLAMVFVVLLIACANVAALLLARATARRRELAVRIALGATRSRLVGQLLIESVLLAVAGSASGLALVVAVLKVVNALILVPGPTGAPIFLDLRIDAQVLGFSMAATAAAVLVFGLVPALHSTKIDLLADLRGSRVSSRWSRGRLHKGLVGLQVALSTTLLIAAVLLSRSLSHASRVDVGFEPENLIVASFHLELPGYDAARIRAFYDTLLERARQLPGVTRAALADFVPMGDRGDSVAVTISDAVQPPNRSSRRMPYNRVSDDYFATMEQRLIEGREFTSHDRQGSQPVAIVNQAFADRFWPAGTALGRRVRIDDEPQAREVVGVGANARYASFGDDVRPMLIVPAHQRAGSQLTLHVRAARLRPGAAIQTPESRTLLGDLVQLARAIDANVALRKGTTMRAAMAFSLFPAQVARAVFGITGIIGLALAACGLYGLIAYTCEQRRTDVGVMIALGAGRHHILQTVVGGGLIVVVCGILAGSGVASLAMRLFASLLYGVGPADPLTFAGVGLLLIAIALAASGAAVRKSLRVDPIVTLRES